MSSECFYTAICGHKQKQDKELTFKKGDKIRFIEKCGEDDVWFLGELTRTGTVGRVFSEFVSKLADANDPDIPGKKATFPGLQSTGNPATETATEKGRKRVVPELQDQGLEELKEGKGEPAARLKPQVQGSKTQKTETASSPHSRGTPKLVTSEKGNKRPAELTELQEQDVEELLKAIKSKTQLQTILIGLNKKQNRKAGGSISKMNMVNLVQNVLNARPQGAHELLEWTLQIIGYVIPGELKKALENLQKNRRQEVAARLSLVSRSAGTAGSADSNTRNPAMIKETELEKGPKKLEEQGKGRATKKLKPSVQGNKTQQTSPRTAPSPHSAGPSKSMTSVKKETKQAAREVGSNVNEDDDPTELVMLCLCYGELDLDTAFKVGVLAKSCGAKLLQGSDLGLRFFNARETTLVSKGKCTEYAKFVLGYVEPVVKALHELPQNSSKEKLVNCLLYRTLDKKWPSERLALVKHSCREHSEYVCPRCNTNLLSREMDFELGEACDMVFDAEPPELVDSEEGLTCWLGDSDASKGPGNTRMQLTVSRAPLRQGSKFTRSHLPGNDETRFAMLRLFRSFQEDFVQSFVLIFRAIDDIEGLLERERIVAAEMEAVERPKKSTSFEIRLHGDTDKSTFLELTDKSELENFLRDWQKRVEAAFKDENTARPAVWTAAEHVSFRDIECVAVEGVPCLEPIRLDPEDSAFSQNVEKLAKMLLFGSEEQVQAVSLKVRYGLSDCPPDTPVTWPEVCEPSWKVPNRVYEEQKAVAERIVQRMAFVLKEGGKALNEFTKLRFVVLVPNYTTLRDQTLLRVRGLLPGADESVVFRYIEGNQSKFNAFRSDIMRQSNSDTLFVLVADECHWAVKKDSPHDWFVNDSRNQGELLDRPNFVILRVSATPYNVLTINSRIPCRPIEAFDLNGAPAQVVSRGEQRQPEEGDEELHVIEWFPKHNTSARTSRYVRFETYLKTIQSRRRHNETGRHKRPNWMKHIRGDEVFEKLKQNISEEDVDLVLLVDYVFSLVYFKTVRWDSASGMLRPRKECAFEAPGMHKTAEQALHTFQELLSRHDLTEIGKTYLEQLDDEDDDMEGDDIEADVQKLAAVFRKKLESEVERSALELKSEEEDCTFTETDQIICDLLSTDPKTRKGRMKLIRTYSSEKAHRWQSTVLDCRKQLFPCQDQSSPPFAVIADTGAFPLETNLETWVQDRTVPFCTCSPEPENPGSCPESHTVKSLKKRLQYVHLLDLPCLLILVHKGRMGDTFPESMDCLDLRIRISDNQMTLVQELGRLCRYPKLQPHPVSEPSAQLDGFKKLQHESVKIDSDSWDAAAKTCESWFQDRRHVAVFSQDGIFAGYATHVGKFEGQDAGIDFVARGNVKSADKDESGQISVSDMISLDGGAVEAGEYLLCPWNAGSRKTQSGRKTKQDDMQPSPAASSCLIHLSQGAQGAWTLTADADIPRGTVLLARDSTALESLFVKCAKTCFVQPLQYRLPYALLRKVVMAKLQDAVDEADNMLIVSKMEVGRCLKMKSLDAYVTPASRNMKVADYHNYRKSWKPSRPSTSRQSQKVNFNFDAEERADHRKHHHRGFLLNAECQIGKTGTYIWVLHRLRHSMELALDPLEPDLLEQSVDEEFIVAPPRPVPKPCYWVFPYWSDIAKAKTPDYSRLRNGKYQPRVAKFRFQNFLDAAADDVETWLVQFEKSVQQDEGVRSVQSMKLLQFRLSELRESSDELKVSANSLPRRAASCPDRFSSFTGNASIAALVENALNWDGRLKAPSQPSLFSSGGLLEIEQLPDGMCELKKKRESNWEVVFSGKGDGAVFLGKGEQKRLVRNSLPGIRFPEPPRSFESGQRRTVKLANGIRQGALALDDLFPHQSVKLSIPQAFLDKKWVELEQGKLRGLTERAGDFRWIFHPTANRSKVARLDFSGCFEEGLLKFGQIFVVKDDQYDTYLKAWHGYPHAIILSLPNKLRPSAAKPEWSADFSAESGGIGYSRLFIQLFAHLMGLHFVWVLDDNIAETRELDLEGISESTGHSSEHPPKYCPLFRPLQHIEHLVDSRLHPLARWSDGDKQHLEQWIQQLGQTQTDSEWNWRQSPQEGEKPWKQYLDTAPKMDGPVDGDRLFNFTGRCSAVGLIGIHRCWQEYQRLSKPFTKTYSVYSFLLLNTKHSVEAGVLYSPKKAWEDIDFAFDLMDSDFEVIKVNRWFHRKLNMQPLNQPKVCSTQLIKDASMEEDVALECEDEIAFPCNESMLLSVIHQSGHSFTSSRNMMTSFLLSYVDSCPGIVAFVGPKALRWAKFCDKTGLFSEDKVERYGTLGEINNNKVRGVVVLQDKWHEKNEMFALAGEEDSIVKDALKSVERNRVKKKALWQEALIVIPVDTAETTAQPLRWSDFVQELPAACSDLRIWSTVSPRREDECQYLDFNVDDVSAGTHSRIHSRLPFILVGVQLRPLS